MGAATLAAVDTVSFDLVFIGCSGFDDEGRVTDYDLEKIAVKQLAMRRADASVLLADATKFARRPTAAVAPLPEFERVITDGDGDGPLRHRIGDLVRNLTIAE